MNLPLRPNDEAASSHLAVEREGELQLILDSVPALVFYKDREGRFLRVNRQLAQLVGLPPAAFIGKTDAEMGSSEGPRYHADDLRVITTGEPVRQVEEPLHTAGGIRWLLTDKVPLRDESGRIIGVIGFSVDITERKRAEGDHDRLFNLSLDLLCIAGFDGRLKQVNPAWTKCLGWTAGELTSRPMLDFILPEDHAATLAARARLFQGHPLRGFENRYRCKDGSFRWLSWNVQAVVESREVFSVAHDVTERKQAEAERLLSEARYRTLFEYAPDGIVIADAGSRYLDANAAMCRMLGYTREELIGLHASDIVTAGEAAHIESALHSIHSKADYHREWQFRRKDGSVFTAEVIATLMPDGNLLGMIRDLTERKRLEAQFLRAQRMEGIGTLASGIAHDLNNALLPILMSVEMLSDLARDDGDRAVLATLESSAQRAAALVRQVLSFSCGVEGQRIPVNPVLVVRDLLKVLRDTFPKNIDLRFQPAEGVWMVTGDPTQMHQVIVNLCVNARDAMPGGGHVTITMENRVLDETYAVMHPGSPPGAYVLVQVEDSGTGIPAAIRDRIFEPFFTTKEFGKGTGLGLSSTQAIVKSHGGFIEVYSEVGKGTTFGVYLPANPAPAVVDETIKQPASLAQGHGELILVVDDEAAIRDLAQRTLERHGYRVLLAGHGAEAVAIYARRQAEIAVVLTDMSMPVMDGPALVHSLRSINPKVAVIGSSGLTSQESAARAAGEGLRHFIPKPYAAETLLAVLHEVLAG